MIAFRLEENFKGITSEICTARSLEALSIERLRMYLENFCMLCLLCVLTVVKRKKQLLLQKTHKCF